MVDGATVEAINDVAARPRMAAAVRVISDGEGYSGGDSPQRRLMITTTRPPYAMACEVWVRAGGEEVRFTDVSFEKGKGGNHVSRGRLPEGVKGPVDVILRPSEEVAKRTLGVEEFWAGEVVIEGVEGP